MRIQLAVLMAIIFSSSFIDTGEVCGVPCCFSFYSFRSYGTNALHPWLLLENDDLLFVVGKQCLALPARLECGALYTTSGYLGESI